MFSCLPLTKPNSQIRQVGQIQTVANRQILSEIKHIQVDPVVTAPDKIVYVINCLLYPNVGQCDNHRKNGQFNLSDRSIKKTAINKQ
jgi:hypothetical protein